MKQPEDNKTNEMFGGLFKVKRTAAQRRAADAGAVAKGRGRPVSGNAKTPAQRKAEQRARLKAAGVETVTVTLSAELVAALKKQIKFKDETQSAVVERILRNQLLRKR